VENTRTTRRFVHPPPLSARRGNRTAPHEHPNPTTPHHRERDAFHTANADVATNLLKHTQRDRKKHFQTKTHTTLPHPHALSRDGNLSDANSHTLTDETIETITRTKTTDLRINANKKKTYDLGIDISN
jgi:hypothetical protein